MATTGKNITSTPTADIQSKLGITSDGIYGPQTTQAVISFQKANGLTPDGIVGPLTLAKLFPTITQNTNQINNTQQPNNNISTSTPTNNPTSNVNQNYNPSGTGNFWNKLGITDERWYSSEFDQASKNANLEVYNYYVSHNIPFDKDLSKTKTATNTPTNSTTTTTNPNSDIIKKFQEQHMTGQTPTGTLDQETINAINYVYGLSSGDKSAQTTEQKLTALGYNLSSNNTSNQNTNNTNNNTSTITNNLSSLLSNGNLQIGSSGSQVSQLQALLGGITIDGKFGPQTQTAVKTFQAENSLKVDGIVGPQTVAALEKIKSSGSSPVDNTNPRIDNNNQNNNSNTTNKYLDNGEINPNYKEEIPSTGNTEIDKLISVLNNQSPQKSFVDIYKEVYSSLGLDTIKEDYENQTKEYTDLQEKKNEEIQKINNDPWYSEGKKQMELKKLDNKYEGKETILINKLKLLESNISNGRSDAQYISSQIMDQLQQSSKLSEDIIMKAIDIAEKSAEAENKLKTSTTKTSTSDYVKIFSDVLKTGITASGQKIGNPKGSDGFADPYVYITAFNEWPGTTAEFLSKFPVAKNVNPASYSLLPEAIRPTTKSSSSSNDIEP